MSWISDLPELRHLSGLSQAEARRRLSEEGPNEIPMSESKRALRILMDVLREPMILLLVACAVTYLILGSLTEAILLIGSMMVILGISFHQERKTQKALESLRRLSSPRALVLRDGVQQRIAGADVVSGDLVILQEGDRVVADGVLHWTLNLMTDESLLSGESFPIEKKKNDPVFSGTLVVRGQALASVTATGLKSEMGKIGQFLQQESSRRTRLQSEMGRLIRVVAFFGAAVCIAIVMISGLVRGQWIQGTLGGLTAAMSLLPEEFPVVFSVFLAMGAWRMSRHGVLARNVSAIENLGAATVLCVDKTGTLTMNRMSLARLRTGRHSLGLTGAEDRLPEEFHELVEYAVLASHRDPFDPMEKAIQEVGIETLSQTEHLHGDWRLVREYPLSPELMAMSCVWRSPSGNDYCVASKGSPEAIIDLCHLPEERSLELFKQVQKMAQEGLRVLAVAQARFREGELPKHQHDFDFEFVGFLGLADPVRPGVPEAIAECRRAGIRVIMMTGDYSATAQNIAQEVGLDRPENVITGSELDRLDSEELRRRLHDTNVFARMVPSQKMKIIAALQRDGHVVAMTGDGVNDAPSLKAADIGIAMGARGTDVAREAADLVLLNDDFASLTESVWMGRRIYDNIRKAISYLVAVHIPIAGMSLIPVLLGWPLALFPLHIVALELLIDPACSLVFEVQREEKGLRSRPPRPLSRPLWDIRDGLKSALCGLASLVASFGVYGGVYRVLNDGGSARTLGFIVLVVSNVLTILFFRRGSSFDMNSQGAS